jgi:hypothetical protein
MDNDGDFDMVVLSDATHYIGSLGDSLQVNLVVNAASTVALAEISTRIPIMTL